jgi:hypothetical protein
MKTMATTKAAMPVAGTMIPDRRSRPFLLRAAVRDPGSGPVLRDAPLKDGPFREGTDGG